MDTTLNYYGQDYRSDEYGAGLGEPSTLYGS